MSQGRSWLTWIAAVVASGIAGIWLSVGAGGRDLYANPEAIPSAIHTERSPRWSEAVDRAQRIIRATMAEQNLPGLSVAVGAEGGIVWAEGFGWADIETRAPVSPKTRFRIGSASTALTSAAVGALLDKGRLALDDEIQTYVPQFPKKQWPVTLRELMAHMGGVGPVTEDDGPLFRQRCDRPVDAAPQFAHDPLLYEPGTQYRYSNYGWILASAAVEAAAHEPFLTFMREAVFVPLRMDDTGAESAKEENPEGIGEPGEDAPFITLIRQAILKPLGIVKAKEKPPTDPATLYLPGFGPHPLIRYGLHGMRLGNLSCYAGSLAFFSTASDLVRFGLGIHRGTLLRAATAHSLLTPQRLKSGQETSHGLGWNLHTVTLAGAPTQAAGFEGELRGQRVAALILYREAGIVVAVLANMGYADPAALALKVGEAFAPTGR